VEGLTEFLPVSSTGHLILVGHLLGFTGATADSVEISIQLGAILAVVAYERRKIVTLLSQAREQATALARVKPHESAQGWRAALLASSQKHQSLWFLIGLAIAFLPAALTGFLLHDWIETHLFRPFTVAIALIIGGIIILGVEATRRRVTVTQLEDVGIRTAFGVGLAQCVALFPGISRSGATIVGGLLLGMDRKVATEYSFFLALPTMIGATVYKMLKSFPSMTPDELLALALGLLVSFVVAWIVIAAFLAFVKRHTLRAFAYYRILVGFIVLIIFPS
ncbi:MAG: undecaprenyl-diphosphate phosphatase, partial [Nitrospiraceae bacterium]